MERDIPLSMQTAYADLLDRAEASAFDEDFHEPGLFTPKTIKERRYWYFQPRGDPSRKQRYVGPESSALLERIRHHRQIASDRRALRSTVAMLVASARLPAPTPSIGRIVATLSKAGLFRLRAVLVGTVAYQTYAGKLGARLPSAQLTTADVDIAQFADVSVAVDDQTIPMIDILLEADPTFREVPHHRNPKRSATYVANDGTRVDFLTPNRGPESEEPRALRALRTDAQPLRFLDFLIRDPEPAVVLYDAGVPVMVPAPERFALHKLIVARRRSARSDKRSKDLRQAEALLLTLTRKRPHELRDRWEEAVTRGQRWRTLLGEGLSLIDADTRDRLLMTVGTPRSFVPGVTPRFPSIAPRVDHDRHAIALHGESGESSVRFFVSAEALEDHFGAKSGSDRELMSVFREHRDEIEHLLRTKYLEAAVEAPNETILTTMDVEELRSKRSPTRRRDQPHSR